MINIMSNSVRATLNLSDIINSFFIKETLELKKDPEKFNALIEAKEREYAERALKKPESDEDSIDDQEEFTDNEESTDKH
jgi:hypothetical protein